MGSRLLMGPQIYELWAQVIDGRANMNYGLQILTGCRLTNYGLQSIDGPANFYELWAPNIDGPANFYELWAPNINNNNNNRI